MEEVQRRVSSCLISIDHHSISMHEMVLIRQEETLHIVLGIYLAGLQTYIFTKYISANLGIYLA
jgi:hypothetical protein